MNWMEAYTHQFPAENLGRCGFCGGYTRSGNRYEPALVHVGIPVAGFPWHMATHDEDEL